MIDGAIATRRRMNARHLQRTLAADAVRLGSYPTPLWQLPGTDQAHDIWIKDDGRTGNPYGGNKVRKLELLLAAARRRGAKRLLTVGAAGSHHVLATCVYGARVGLGTHAVLTPQPWTEHAEATLRAGLNAGLSATPAGSYLAALAALRRERRPGDFVIAPGGSGTHGTWAYCLAVDELREQLMVQQLPALDAIIVAAGSGSTAAGLLAGILRTGAAKRVIAVQVAPNRALGALIIGQAASALWRHDQWRRAFAARRALHVETRFAGDGYGHPTMLGARASELARSFGLELEPTYTAKAFAAVLSWANATPGDNRGCKLQLHRRQTYLYWHTLSAVPLAALLVGAPEKLPCELAHLLLGPSVCPRPTPITPPSRR
jgi:D-cysteine desulfhydrase